MTGTVPGVADIAAVRERVDALAKKHWPRASVTSLKPLLGGQSSLTYVTTMTAAPAERMVVKMAPPGLEPVRNRDVLRQARILRALGSVADVRVPKVYFSDDGAPPAVPPLFTMEFADGDSFEPLRARPDTPTPSEAEVATRSLGAVRMLAALQGAGPSTLGLAAEPVISLQAEVTRWSKAFASCDLPAQVDKTWRRCEDLLHRSAPQPLPAVVQHGDWRLGNMKCRGTSIQAVIDWELWSLGDPRIDLAWMMMWASTDHPSTRDRSAFTPGPRQILHWYEDACGASVPEIWWAQALVRYKEGAAMSLLAKNAGKRGEESGKVTRLYQSGIRLLTWAEEFLK